MPFFPTSQCNEDVMGPVQASLKGIMKGRVQNLDFHRLYAKWRYCSHLDFRCKQ